MTNEEIRLKLGLDASDVTTGTNTMISQQSAAAARVKDIWKVQNAEIERSEAESLARRELEYKQFVESEIAAENEAAAERIAIQEKAAAADAILQEASWKRYQANVANKIALDKKWIEEQAAMREIAAGSGGTSWMGGPAGAGGLEAAAQEVEHGSAAVLSRESMVLVREGLRGNWERMFGSFTILLNAMGGQVKKLMSGLLGGFGLVLGAVAAGAYMLYEDIKNFNSEIDELGNLGAKSIGDRQEAIKESMDKGIAAAAEYEAHIRDLADAHETLAHWMERVNKDIADNASRQQAVIGSRANQQVAAVNLAESLGMMTGPSASAARAGIRASAFAEEEKSKQDALLQQGRVLLATQAEAERRKEILEANGRAAQAAATGVNERGEITNAAAFKRNQQMRERENLKKDIEDRQKWSADHPDEHNYSGSALASAENVLRWFDPLSEDKANAFSENQAVIKREQDLLRRTEEQNRGNIAAQKAAEEAYKKAVKDLDENAQSLKEVNAALDEYKQKWKDSGVAMQNLMADLQAQQLQNKSAQLKAAADADRVTPTIEDLAGRSYTERLNKAYGAGGMYDLGAGDGPYARAAQDYELAQKQQMWDIIHGNAVFNSRGDLIGGDAWADKQRSVSAHNLLSAAGLDTPAMKMQEISENAKTIADEITALTKLMGNKPVVKVDGTDT